MHAFAAVLVSTCLATATAAQRENAPAVLRVGLTVKSEGSAEPRLDRSGKDTGARRWSDRALEWRIGKKTLTSAADAKMELTRLAQDPSSMRDSEHQPGLEELMPLGLDADPAVRWCEMLAAWDAVMDAGFVEFDLRGAGTRYLVVKAVAEPMLDGGALVVPHAVYCEPDDMPDRDRAAFSVRQDGSIEREGRVLFRWRAGKEDDLAALQEELRALRAAMKEAGRLGDRLPDGPGAIDVPVLIRADKWCEWRDVRRLMQCLTARDVRYWKFEIAVAEVEQEPVRESTADKDQKQR